MILVIGGALVFAAGLWISIAGAVLWGLPLVASGLALTMAALILQGLDDVSDPALSWWQTVRAAFLAGCRQIDPRSQEAFKARADEQVRKARQRRERALARQIYRARLSRGNAETARLSAAAAANMLPMVEQLEQLSATPNALLSIDEALLQGQLERQLAVQGIDTDRIRVERAPPIGVFGRLVGVAQAAMGVSPYGRAWRILKIGLAVAPWLGFAGAVALWQGERADGARLESDNRTLRANVDAVSDANRRLTDRALQAEAQAAGAAQALQAAQAQGQRLGREAAQRARGRAAARKVTTAAKEAIANAKNADPDGVGWSGGQWLRDREARASAVRNAAVSGLSDADPGATGPGVLPERPGANVPVPGASPKDAN